MHQLPITSLVQAMAIWASGGSLQIRNSGTNLSEIQIKIQIFPLTKMQFNMSSAKWGPFCVALNLLRIIAQHWKKSMGRFTHIKKVKSRNVGSNYYALLRWPNEKENQKKSNMLFAIQTVKLRSVYHQCLFWRNVQLFVSPNLYQPGIIS